MTDKTNNATDNRLRYRSPEVKVVFVKMQGILCLSEGEGTRYSEEELEPGIFG